MTNILIQPEGAWDYFERFLKPDEMILIAERPEYGIQIFMSELNSRPLITVLEDDFVVYEEEVVSESDLIETINEVFDDFLTSRIFETLAEIDGDVPETKDEPPMDDEAAYQQFEIDTREEELDDAVIEFLVVAADYINVSTRENKKMIRDIKEAFLKYLYEKHNLEIYRPMFLIDDKTGEEFFEEYPYECFI